MFRDRLREIAERIESYLAETMPTANHWLAAGSLAVIAVVVAVAVFVYTRPVEESAPSRPLAPQVLESKTRPRPRRLPRVAVHVAGQVNRPQVYFLRAGSRVVDAIAAAGGATPAAETDALNLAAKVVDGQRIYIPAKGEAQPAAAAEAQMGDSLTDINQASAEDLEKLDGIGPTLAKRIVEYRGRVGAFRRVDQLQEVDGIGPKKMARLKGQVTVR